MWNDLTLDETRRLAARAGLTQLTDEHLQQLLQATQTAKARCAALPTDKLTPADEPAHILRLNRHDDR